MRWLVGDLQGCARPFAALLKMIHFDPGQDEIWCLGDLINRGPDSLATLRLWRDIGGKAVLGNHDVYALSTRAGIWPRKRDTLQELFAAPDCDELLLELAMLPVLVHLPVEDPKRQDVWIIHAGLHPQWKNLHEVSIKLQEGAPAIERLRRPEVRFGTTVRCCSEEGERSHHDGAPEDCPLPYRPWDSFYEGPDFIVHGHWALRGFYRSSKSMGLDSGCVYGGPLTAWCVEEDRIVQVPPEPPYLRSAKM